MARSALVLVLVLVLVGCSHTYYQFRVTEREEAWVDQTHNALIGAMASDDATLGAVVDLEGRRAAEALAAGVAVDRPSEPQFERLTRALLIGLVGDGVDPHEVLTGDVIAAALRIGQRVATSEAGVRAAAQVADSFGLPVGGLPAVAAAAVGDTDADRYREMRDSLRRGELQTCQGADVVVSYDAGILSHVDLPTADGDPRYQAWRERVRAIHLVHLPCQGRRAQHVLELQTRSADRAGLRVIGWHFFTEAQWQRLQPELREALDLPAR
jgi:hypothetical protein